MKSLIITSIFLFSCFCTNTSMATETESVVPEPFRGHDPASSFSIGYGDLDALLKMAVVDVGRSDRKKAEAAQATTGTRMKNVVNRATVYEGNRFRFEVFDENEEFLEVLIQIKESLESIPDQVPLAVFSRQEQLAYWLNLYNTTILSEIVDIYPEHSLKKVLTGRKSILPNKVLTVGGVPLSLDDIQHVILAVNYDNDPLIMYGLYQGIIGGPNVRKKAYAGKSVYASLRDNAEEFVNSNRGTETQRNNVFYVSSLYDRNRDLFADFETDLSAHLKTLLNGRELEALKTASKIKPAISDWTITDLYGSYRDLGASFASNRAALLDAVQASTMVDGQIISTSYSNPSGVVIDRAPAAGRFSPELLTHLNELKLKEEAAYLQKVGTVTVEELGQAPEKEGPDKEKNK